MCFRETYWMISSEIVWFLGKKAFRKKQIKQNKKEKWDRWTQVSKLVETRLYVMDRLIIIMFFYGCVYWKCLSPRVQFFIKKE